MIADQIISRNGRALSLLLAVQLFINGCHQSKAPETVQAERLMLEKGCVTCHTFSAMAEATGLVGPPLDEFEKRSYIAGTLPNTDENLIQFLMHPQDFNNESAMPNLDLTRAEAATLTHFLLNR